MAILTLAVLVIFGTFHKAVGLVTFAVPCNYLTPTCECPLRNDDGDLINVCEFELEISAMQTFTRYLANDTIGKSSTRGEIWTINSFGNIVPHLPFPSVLPTVQCNTRPCTEAHTVDGSTYKLFISTNRRFPGPTIIVNQGQVVSVNVTNSLDSEGLSIHWHGVDQKNTNFMDGVEQLTQCGISPGTSFRYIFEAAQSGTFWYHSHTGVQRTDGLFGALIFRENEDLINQAKQQEGVGDFQDQPADHTLIFVDWQLKSSLELFTLLGTGTTFFSNYEAPSTGQLPDLPYFSQDGVIVSPIPYWSGLVNGKGRHHTVDYVQSRLSIFTVSPSTQYRFRLIGAQGLFAFRFSIDGHKLKVFAMDGNLIKPREVDFIIFHSGERYDFLLETKSSAQVNRNSNFAIRGETLENTPNPPEPPHVAEAILHYDVDSEPSSNKYAAIFNENLQVSKTCTKANRCSALNCPFKIYPSAFNIDCIPVSDMELLFPLDDSELPDVNVEEEDQVFLNFAFEGSGSTATVNARNHRLPSSPLTLLDDDQYEVIQDKEFCTGTSTNSTCNNDPLEVNVQRNPKCRCTHVRTLRFGKSIQMVFSAINPSYEVLDTPLFLEAHPIHLHGHHFQVADIQFGTYNNLGKLTMANDSINCGGTKACTNPRWRPGRDYSIGRTGKVSNTAPLKDTIFLPAGANVVVYFKTDNPGYWYLHCHIESHVIEGMAVVMAEIPDEGLSVPNEMERCGDFTWSVEEFYKHIQGDPTTGGLTAEEVTDDNDETMLSIGLGVGLLVSLIVNVILFVICCFCCVIKRDPRSFKGV